MNHSLFKWFLRERGKFCESFSYDPHFSAIRFHISDEKSKAALITKTNPYCQL